MFAGPRPVARRTTLALGVCGLAALAGCDDPAGESGSAPAPTGSDPDSALVRQVLTELDDALHLAVAASVPDLAELHRAHIAALDGEPTAATARW
ncbi:MAG: hypothetical protein ACJ72B_10400, partial [Ornithinibacter sp.]